MKPTDNLTILAIETSCDDTSVAVLENTRPLANVVSSQLDGQRFGGIVPELASRAHQANILPVIKAALKISGKAKSDLQLIAVTQGPGLIGSLLVGVNTAKAIAFGLGIPIIGIHHIEAHLLAAFLETPGLKFPFVSLIVSGGHTLLVMARSVGNYEILGETVDDAAGECFDKTARLLDLKAGEGQAMTGPVVDKRAKNGNPAAIAFPRPMLRSGDLNFSFSGLKTSVLNYVQKHGQRTEQETNDICASFQEAAVDVLVEKSMQACRQMGVSSLVVAGGVAANSRLRERMGSECLKHEIGLHVPRSEYCTDNAAMIGIAGFLHYSNGHASGMDLTPYASRSLA